MRGSLAQARALIYQPDVAGECTDQVGLITDMVYESGAMMSA